MSIRASISLQNFRHNVSLLMKHCNPSVIFLPALKANAYGHGLVECVGALSALTSDEKKRVYGIGLARVSEILELRQANIWDRVVLYSHATGSELATLFSTRLSHKAHGTKVACENVEFVVGSAHYLREIVSFVRASDTIDEARIHLKCDTGMGRLGVAPEQFGQLYHTACIEGCSIVGVCTHFSATDAQTIHTQSVIFSKILEQLGEKKHFLVIHAANSGSTVWESYTHHTMVRPGIVLYGAHPQPMRQLPPTFSLAPVMKVTSHVACVKKVAKNHGISYLSTYKTKKNTHIAVINAGYGDGVPIYLSNCGIVHIHNKAYPIVGRVCMDMFMVDVGENIHGVQPDDEVVLWGNGRLSIDVQALNAHVISYELLCAIGNNCRVEKVFVENHEEVKKFLPLGTSHNL